MTEDKQTLGKKELRNFGLTSGSIVVGLFGLLLPWLFNRPFPSWPWIFAGILWAWALVLPKTLRSVYRGWMTLGHGLGWINSRIILGLMFYVMVLPIGIIMRLLGNDPMARNFDRDGSTYRILSRKSPKEQMEKPF